MAHTLHGFHAVPNGMIRWYSQVFAGYVLHVGPMPISLKVGDEVFCEVSWLRAKAELSWFDKFHSDTSNKIPQNNWQILPRTIIAAICFAKNLDLNDTLEVDYEHRSKVAPNHTMTHVLNWALREAICKSQVRSVMSGGPKFEAFLPASNFQGFFSHQG